jgi:hypothetical protein
VNTLEAYFHMCSPEWVVPLMLGVFTGHLSMAGISAGDEGAGEKPP